MDIKYIKDKKGKTSAVLIPIEEWERIKQKLNKIQDIEGKNEKKPSEKFYGSISQKRADELHDELKKMRSEWDRKI